MILCVCPNPSIDTIMRFANVAPGQPNRAVHEQALPGGSGIRMALAAKALGADVQLLCYWSGDAGQELRQQCIELGIPCSGPEISGSVRRTVIIEAPEPFHGTHFLGCGPTVDRQATEAFKDAFEQALPRCQCVVLSGDLPVGAPPSVYAELIGLVNTAHKPVLLDCSGKAFLRALSKRPFAVHMSRPQAADYLGFDHPIKAGVKLSALCELATVTDDNESYFFTLTNRIVAQCMPDAQHSSFGASDCLMAALAIGCERQLSLAETIRLAVASSAAVRMCESPGRLKKQDVDALIPKVKIRKT